MNLANKLDLSKIPPKKQKNLMSLFIASKDDNIKDDLLITLTQSLGYASYYSKPKYIACNLTSLTYYSNFIKKYDAIFEILLVNLDSSRLKESKVLLLYNFISITIYRPLVQKH